MLVMAELTGESKYEIVIERSTGWLKIPWHELWDYRDLLYLLVQRDFISRYKQTILGPLWHLIQPLLTTVVFVIFARAAHIPTDSIPAPLFFLCGLLVWNYFNQNITTGGATFVNNAHLFGKVYFPRLIVPISIVIANLVAVALQAIPFLLVLGYYKFFTHSLDQMHLTWLILLFPLPLIQTCLLSLGIGLWMSAGTAKFRDLVHLNQYIVQIWMFATPVLYPLSIVPAHWRWVNWVNPVSVPVEAFRLCLFGQGSLEPHEIVLSILMTLFLLLSGIAIFQRVERTVIDIV
jgi:lipopolysaccharide transport system permease protein